MSSNNNIVFNNGQQMQIQTNRAKLFPLDKEYASYPMTNSSYVDTTYPAGTVMGVVAATGKVVPFTSGASDGSQYCMGILADDSFIAAGNTVNVPVMVKGRVRKDMLILQGSDTLNTVVASRRVFEKIGSDSVGILIIGTTNVTTYDNTLP